MQEASNKDEYSTDLESLFDGFINKEENNQEVKNGRICR